MHRQSCPISPAAILWELHLYSDHGAKLFNRIGISPDRRRVHLCRRISSHVSSMILLRDVLVLLPALAQALQPAKSQLLIAIRCTVEHPVFGEMQQHVEAVIDEVSASSSTLPTVCVCLTPVTGRIAVHSYAGTGWPHCRRPGLSQRHFRVQHEPALSMCVCHALV